MPVVENPAVGGEDKDVDEENDLADGKPFFPVDDDRQNFRAIDASAMANDEASADAQDRAADDDDLERIADKGRQVLKSDQEEREKEDCRQHVDDETSAGYTSRPGR